MIHSVRFKAVLDTNVIFPVIIRDLLFWFAHHDLYTPKWSENIFDEWVEVMRRKGVEKSEAEKRVNIANQAFPDALVKNTKISLPEDKLLSRPDGREIFYIIFPSPALSLWHSRPPALKPALTATRR